MENNTIFKREWSFAIVLLLLSMGIAIAVYTFRATTSVQEALAAEVLEQQPDVSTLLTEYSNVMLTIEEALRTKNTQSIEQLEVALTSAGIELEKMRSNYTFARLDGAARAHAYVKPILEDVMQWATEGVSNLNPHTAQIHTVSLQRMKDRFPTLREIAQETSLVATELIEEQTLRLENFRNALILLLGAFAFSALAITFLLIRQRNMQIEHGMNQEAEVQRLLQAETRGREQAEVALKGSERFLRATLDALPSNIAILGHDGIILATNTPWNNLVHRGVTSDTDGGIGKHYTTVFNAIARTEMEQQGLITARNDVASVLSGHRFAAYSEFADAANDQRRWYSVSVSTFETQNVLQAIVVHADISQRKRLEERDRRLRAELAHASRLNTAGEMASGLAHELNQPLTAISHNSDAALADIKLQKNPDIELLNTMSDIYDQAQRAGAIIRSMRQMVRKGSSEAVATDMNKLVRETVRLTQPEARENGVHVSLHLAEDLPHPVIDPVQIQQVLVNLERNGVDSMSQSNSLRRELTIKTSLDNLTYVKVSISDTGPGINEEVSAKLFTAFQTTKKQGMGLGLSISRSIVEQHDGRLWLDQSQNGVTIFHFTVPVSKG